VALQRSDKHAMEYDPVLLHFIQVWSLYELEPKAGHVMSKQLRSTSALGGAACTSTPRRRRCAGRCGATMRHACRGCSAGALRQGAGFAPSPAPAPLGDLLHGVARACCWATAGGRTWEHGSPVQRWHMASGRPACLLTHSLVWRCQLALLNKHAAQRILFRRCTTVTMGLKSGIVGLPNVGKVRPVSAYPRLVAPRLPMVLATAGRR